MHNTKIFTLYNVTFFISNLSLKLEDVKKDISRLPAFFYSEVNKIYIYNAEDLDTYDLDSSYGHRIVKIDSSKIESRKDLMKTLIHELYHSIQNSIKNTFKELFENVAVEYLQKKKKILDVLASDARVTPPEQSFYTDIFYNEKFDAYLYKIIGYKFINNRLKDYFPSAYSITSIDEYIATCFEIFYFENEKWLSIYCPEVYNLIKTVGAYEKEN